jgi:hypothetical protein
MVCNINIHFKQPYYATEIIMKKIKYQGGLTKLITSKLGKKNKGKFGAYIQEALATLLLSLKKTPLKLDVVSFSSNRDCYDQLLSILSFVRYAGIPDSWTVYSDGSHTADQIKLLEKTGFVQVLVVDWNDPVQLTTRCKSQLMPYADVLVDYASKFPLGKKLYSYLNHKISKKTLFLDADILFYKKAALFERVLDDHSNGWYLPDNEWGNLDSRYKQLHAEQLYQINSGFFLLNKELSDVSSGLNFLKGLNYEYEYFTEQNVFHIIFRSNGFMPLDPRIFVLNSGDQFDFSYLYEREEIAMRHYTGPVRHKMWQRDWKWQLSLS